jgi:hypothetical protein
MVFNTTFNNISVIWWRSILLAGETWSTQRKLPTCRNHWREEFENAKGVIRICKSKQYRQHNGQKKKYTRTNNDLQKSSQKTKDGATWTSLKIGGELRCSGRVGSPCSTSDTRHVTLVISHQWRKDLQVLKTSGTYPWSFVTDKLYQIMLYRHE